uniref:peptidylprolyl isomerase n=1 Tax=Prasinoderma coloniale TaxID=156133 RepID=A0A7R9XWU9_9VIRI|eukprot:PRCOL_00006761-RA
MGFEIETIKEGDGKTFPVAGDILEMHYVGTLAADGKKFDSSRDKGKPFKFTIGHGQVIRGWDEGIMKMSVGQRAKLKVTADYGYGARGAGFVIPPNADLVFDVEFLRIVPTGESIKSDFLSKLPFLLAYIAVVLWILKYVRSDEQEL